MACPRKWWRCLRRRTASRTPRAPRANEKRRLRQPPPGSRAPPHPSFVRLADRPPKADLAVVDANVETALGVVAHPRLVGDGRSFASIIAERKHGSLAAFATVRQLAHIHCSSPPPVRHSRPAHTSTGSPDPDHAPGVLPVEGLVEIEDVAELIARIRWLADEQAEVHEREDDVAQIRGGDHTPVLEHKPGHHAKTLDGQVAARFGELTAGDVTALRQPGLAELQGGEHEEIRSFIEARLASPNAVHDPIAETQLRQRELSLSQWPGTGGGRRRSTRGKDEDREEKSQ